MKDYQGSLDYTDTDDNGYAELVFNSDKSGKFLVTALLENQNPSVFVDFSIDVDDSLEFL